MTNLEEKIREILDESPADYKPEEMEPYIQKLLSLFSQAIKEESVRILEEQIMGEGNPNHYIGMESPKRELSKALERLSTTEGRGK